MAKTVIRIFNQLITNADDEDIGNDVLTSLRNFRYVNGKLVKTFGYGDLGLTSLSPDPINIVTYIHKELSDGYAYMAIIIDPTTYLLSIKVWNKATSTWEDIDSALGGAFKSEIGNIYHRYGVNPNITYKDVLRLLPGNVGKPDGTNPAVPVWIGYIDRDYFDSNYVASTVSGVSQYIKKFFVYDALVERPVVSDIGISKEEMDDGSSTLDENIYFRFSNVYDGVEESLLSKDFVFHRFTADNKFLKLSWNITKADHNKRKTGMNIYQSTTPDGDFQLATKIDYLRRADDAYEKSGTSAGLGKRMLYVPALKNYSFNKSYQYRIVASETKEIINPYGENDTGTYEIISSELDYSVNIWNEGWYLQYNSGSGWHDVYVDGIQIQGSDGAYGGVHTVIIRDTNITLVNRKYINEVFFYSINGDITDQNIVDNVERAVKFSGMVNSTDYTASSWAIVSATFSYFVIDKTTYVEYDYYWRNYTGSGSHYALNEKYIKVNGKFAKMIQNRLIQANIILDPGGDDEEAHPDWLSYSELDQPDVTRVSNVIPLQDREGGEITGLAESFGDIVVFKKHSHFRIHLINNSDGSLSWVKIESKSDLGNYAPNGIIEDGDNIYFCAYDGIYRTNANIVAQADKTPMQLLKVTEPINDIYLALTNAQKESIIGTFDKKYNENIWLFYDTTDNWLWASDGDTENMDDRLQSSDGYYLAVGDSTGGKLWAYNPITKGWRSIDIKPWPSVFTFDQNSDVLFLNELDSKFYGRSVVGNANCELTTKTFFVSNERKDILRFVWLTYKSATPLTVKLYVDGSESAIKSATLPASDNLTNKIIAFRHRCNKFKLQVVDSTYNKTETEIHKLEFEPNWGG